MVPNNLHMEKRPLSVPSSGVGTTVEEGCYPLLCTEVGRVSVVGCLLCGGTGLSAMVIWRVLGGALWLSLLADPD